MQFTTLVSIAAVLANLPVDVVATDPYPTVTSCATITSTEDPYNCPTPILSCTVLACLEIQPITQSCGCPPIGTTKTCPTACPTSCGSTSYVSVIQDCVSTNTSTSSTPPSTTPHYPTTTPPTLPPTWNTTKTKTDTEIITITTCPPSTTCVGQTVTYTSTEVCPTTTCTCVLPSVTFTTTELPPPEETGTAPPPPETVPTSPEGNMPPAPTGTPSATPTFIESNVAAGKWGVSLGAGVLGGLMFAVLGMM